MPSTRPADELETAARVVVSEWRRFVEAVQYALREDVPGPLHHVLRDSILTLNRSLILFLCGGENGRHDSRDIQPADFLGHNWYPTDDEMDQRLRGRLRVISKNRAHLTWHRAQDPSAVIWPLALVVWETSWTFGQFISALRAVGSPVLPIFEEAEQSISAGLPARRFDRSTNEYGLARTGQQQF